MIRITDPVPHVGANVLGHDARTVRHRERVTASDVGSYREHYRGYNHSKYRFVASDVGREIEVINAPGYTSWGFVQATGD